VQQPVTNTHACDQFGPNGRCQSFTLAHTRFADGSRLVVGVTLRADQPEVVGAEWTYSDKRHRAIGHYIACTPRQIGALVPMLNELSIRTNGGTVPLVGTKKSQGEIGRAGLERWLSSQGEAARWRAGVKARAGELYADFLRRQTPPAA
jgi:hypothetical protein